MHHLLANGITPADTALANILGATVKIFTTRCVIAELRSLGDSFSGSVNAARNLITARCDHEKRKTAAACITEVIGENNPEHFFVATQDAELRKKFQEIPGVPVVYALRNALFLERPSAVQHEFAKTAEEGRSHMTEFEYKILKVKKNRGDSEEACGTLDANDDNENHQDHKKNDKPSRIVMNDKAQFKRKRAKGPNPLSCKKKKTKVNENSPAGKESKTVDNSVRTRSRKRMRSKKNQSVRESSGGI